MKSKIGLIAVLLTSGLLLSACTNKQSAGTDVNSTNGTQVEQETNNSPETAGKKGPGQQMDLVAAAETLGVTEDALKEALGITEQTKEISTTPGAKPSGEPKKMDLVAAAETLGVTEDALKEALGMNNIPSGGVQGERPEGSPPTEE